MNLKNPAWWLLVWLIEGVIDEVTHYLNWPLQLAKKSASFCRFFTMDTYHHKSIKSEQTDRETTKKLYEGALLMFSNN